MPNYTDKLQLEQPLDSEQYDVGVTRRNNQKIDDFAGTIPKLYSNVGANTDGALTQKATRDNFVRKSGDTMTNTLTIQRNTSHQLILKNTALTVGSQSGYISIDFRDGSDIVCGSLYRRENVGSHCYTAINCNNSNEDAYIGVGFDENDNARTYVSTNAEKPITHNSNSIATTRQTYRQLYYNTVTEEDGITNRDVLVCAGFISGSQKNLVFTVPLEKNISRVTINTRQSFAMARIRGVNGGYLISSDVDLFSDNAIESIAVSRSTNNTLEFFCTFKNAVSVANNTPCTVSFQAGYLSLAIS